MDIQVLSAFTKDTDCDVYVYSGDITPSGADKLISKVHENKNRRARCYLLLTTHGGDPNAAYRMARACKRIYGDFTVCVFGLCKSAGTLIALGAKDIIMTEFGELGPLDIQMPKVDELDNESGLIYSQALDALKAHAFQFFETCYLEIKTNSGGIITTKTASTIATELSVGLFSPLAEQIDPLKVGEATRAMDISFAYGSRLTTNTVALSKLVREYSTHGFVIDYEEASELLGNVRELSSSEESSIGQFKTFLRHPKPQLFVAFLDEILEDARRNNGEEERDDTTQQPSEGSDPGSVSENAGDSTADQPAASDPQEETDGPAGGQESDLKPKRLDEVVSTRKKKL